MSTTKTGHRTIGGWLAAMVTGAVALGACESTMAQGGQVVGWGTYAYANSRPPISSLLSFRAIAAAANHTIAIRDDGSVTGWGRGQYEQLTFPADVTTGGVTAVSTGDTHALAITVSGQVRAWGDNGRSQCNVPAWITGYRVTRVAAGGEHSVALVSLGPNNGVVTCWGNNNRGQCNTPSIGEPAISIAAGNAHSLLVTSSGSVKGWGEPEPASVPSDLPPAREVAAGYAHSIALCGTSVRGWGNDDYGQRTPPSDLAPVTEVAAGDWHTASLLADGTVRCWGRNTHGQCDVPRGLEQVISIAAGAYHTVALRADGSVVGWGDRGYGQCMVPESPGQVTQIAQGWQTFTIGLRTDGTVAVWGSDLNIPTGLSDVVQIAAKGGFALALKQDGSVIQLGPASPEMPADLGVVTHVAAGTGHAIARLSDGAVRCWGNNSYGQSTPPASLRPAIRVYSGSEFSLALHSDGTVTHWGYDQWGVPVIGGNIVMIDGSDVNTIWVDTSGRVDMSGPNWFGQMNVPAYLRQGTTKAVRVAMGNQFAVALQEDGHVRCWGRNDWGQCSAPGQLYGATGISAGSFGAAAILPAQSSDCANPEGAGDAAVVMSGSAWQDVGTWSANLPGGPQVPGALTNVTLGEYGSVGSLCEARCATLDVPAGSTLLVPVDLTQPLAAQDHSIDVGGLARLKGRVWLLATGASVLPADFSVPVVSAGSYDGTFSIIQSTVPPPPGTFLTLVPSASLTGGTTWSLALRDLPSGFSAGSGDPVAVGGAAVAAEAMDLDGDGFDDLALAIDNGPSQPGLLQVILNDGLGNLSEVSYLAQTAPSPVALAVGDLDGDGDDDAAVATASNLSARVYLNGLVGSDPLVPSTVLAVGAVPTSVAVVPWPQPRVAVGAATNTVSVFEPTVSEAQQVVTVPVAPVAMGRRGRIILSGGANPTSVDGLLPAALGRLVVLTPAGDGSYAVTQSVDVPGKPRSLDVADIDRDGIEDAITANLEPQQVASGTPLAVLTLFKGTQTGFGQAVPIAPQGATAGGDVAMVDINADGVRDLVSVHQTLVGQSAAAAILVHQSEPGGALTLGEQSPIAAERPVLCPRGDVLGPQAEGVFVVDAGSAASLQGGGVPPRAIPYRAEVPTTTPCVGDLNLDSAVDGADLGILLSTWGPVTGGAAAADFNQDGAVDGVDLGVLLARWGACQA
jgi:alpha-tubulin suppressor-like RCC1 family protein